MKRSPEWSYGILLVMLGLVFLLCGGMWMFMLPSAGIQRFGLGAICVAGFVGVIGGGVVSYRASRRGRTNDHRIPQARALPRR